MKSRKNTERFMTTAFEKFSFLSPVEFKQVYYSLSRSLGLGSPMPSSVNYIKVRTFIVLKGL